MLLLSASRDRHLDMQISMDEGGFGSSVQHRAFLTGYALCLECVLGVCVLLSIEKGCDPKLCGRLVGLPMQSVETDMQMTPRWEPVRIIVEGGCAAWTTDSDVGPPLSALKGDCGSRQG